MPYIRSFRVLQTGIIHFVVIRGDSTFFRKADPLSRLYVGEFLTHAQCGERELNYFKPPSQYNLKESVVRDYRHILINGLYFVITNLEFPYEEKPLIPL